MRVMAFNLQLAVEVLADITEPSVPNVEHNQEWWAELWADADAPIKDDGRGHLVLDSETHLPVGFGSCTSAFCFAGSVVVRSGIPLFWRVTPYQDEDGRWKYGAGCVAKDDGTRGEWVSTAAARLLGIGDELGGGSVLFAASNTLYDLHFFVAQLAGVETEDVFTLVKEELAKRATPVG